MASPELVLASGSPRRRALLEQLGLGFSVRAPRIDETAPQGDIDTIVGGLAGRKADAVATGLGNGLVLAADTLGMLDGTVLGKPTSGKDARRILASLSGRTHTVATGLALRMVESRRVIDQAEAVVRTEVTFADLPTETIDAYVATGEPLGKAAAYAIQGHAAAYVRRIEGSWTNVVGLPVTETLGLLHSMGFPLPPHLVIPSEAGEHAEVTH